MAVLKILVIEDDFITRNYLRDLFRYSGYECHTAKNASEGFDLYAKYSPQVILCGLILPGVSGMDFLRRIRNHDKKVSFIMLASKSSEKLAVEVFRLGANEYLKKPIQDSDVLPFLKNVASKVDIVKGKDTYGNVKSGKITMDFKTEFGAPSLIVERVMQELSEDYFSLEERTNIEIGLSELITNAIEHGNLGITYKEKSEVMKDDRLVELYMRRLEDETYSSRMVTIEFSYSPEECQWIITDEGNGFNYSNVPNPTVDDNLEKLHGRGIFISKILFDTIEYIGKGNIVKVRKKRSFLL